MDLERFEFGKVAFFQLAIAMICQVSLEKYRPRDLGSRNWGQRQNGQLVMLDAGRFDSSREPNGFVHSGSWQCMSWGLKGQMN